MSSGAGVRGLRGWRVHQARCDASTVSWPLPVLYALEGVCVSGLQVWDCQHGGALGAAVGCEADDVAGVVEAAPVVLVPVPVEHQLRLGGVDGCAEQRLHCVGSGSEMWGHLPRQSACEAWGAVGRVVAYQHVQPVCGVAHQTNKILAGGCFPVPSARARRWVSIDPATRCRRERRTAALPNSRCCRGRPTTANRPDAAAGPRPALRRVS